jgi:hypothetical protein
MPLTAWVLGVGTHVGDSRLIKWVISEFNLI